MRVRTPIAVLDDARPGQERLTVLTGFLGAITAENSAQISDALAALNAANASGETLAGYFSYELGYGLEGKLAGRMPEPRAAPLLWFGRFAQAQHLTGTDIDAWFTANIVGRAYAGPLHVAWTREEYCTRFAQVQEKIRDGDIYQANLTFPGIFSFAGDALALYRDIRPRASAGYGAYLWDGARDILSFSPELFFEISNGVITARPMKGTAPRGDNAQSDSRLRAQLQLSEKDRAENLMIVDLIRNDISRVAQTGSVRVDNLFAVETYPTVHQMVSTIGGDLRDGTKPADIVRALFPCGSVTGAPKIRAMEIIRDLEATPRGLYCGALGVLFPDGSGRFNVAIRTLTIADGRGSLGIGSGVVADSKVDSEYDECLVKARFYTGARKSIGLIETLRFVAGQGLLREAGHLTRMAQSAAALGLPFDETQARDLLRTNVAAATQDMRVRLHLLETGALECTAQAIAQNPEHWTYAVSDVRLQSGDTLARYKVDWREVYDGEFAKLHAATGCDEVLFLNELGEVAEGSRSNLFVRQGEMWLTPPLSAGVLDGVLRRSMLDDSGQNCREQKLSLGDLAKADRVYFGNSLRGLIPAIPVSSGG